MKTSTASSKKAKFFCENCGSEVPEKAKFCKKCGKFFSSVRCPQCGETGSSSDFSNGCPSCGYAGKNGTVSKATVKSKKKRLPKRAKPKKQKAHGEESYLPVWMYVIVVIILVGVVVLLFQNML